MSNPSQIFDSLTCVIAIAVQFGERQDILMTRNFMCVFLKKMKLPTLYLYVLFCAYFFCIISLSEPCLKGSENGILCLVFVAFLYRCPNKMCFEKCTCFHFRWEYTWKLHICTLLTHMILLETTKPLQSSLRLAVLTNTLSEHRNSFTFWNVISCSEY